MSNPRNNPARNNCEWVTEIAGRRPVRQWALINPETELPYLRVADDRSVLVPLVYLDFPSAFWARRATFQNDADARIEAWPPMLRREERAAALAERLAPPPPDPAWTPNNKRLFGGLELGLAVALALLALAFFGAHVFGWWGGRSIQ